MHAFLESTRKARQKLKTKYILFKIRDWRRRRRRRRRRRGRGRRRQQVLPKRRCFLFR
jgi:hypothetical protein